MIEMESLKESCVKADTEGGFLTAYREKKGRNTCGIIGKKNDYLINCTETKEGNMCLIQIAGTTKSKIEFEDKDEIINHLNDKMLNIYKKGPDKAITCKLKKSLFKKDEYGDQHSISMECNNGTLINIGKDSSIEVNAIN